MTPWKKEKVDWTHEPSLPTGTPSPPNHSAGPPYRVVRRVRYAPHRIDARGPTSSFTDVYGLKKGKVLMPKCRVLSALVLMAVLACQPPEMTRQQRIQFQEAVTARFDGWVTAMNSGNRDEILAYYHEHDQLVVFWPDGTVAKGFDGQRLELHNFLNATRYMNFVTSQKRTELLGSRTALSTFAHSTDVISQDSNREVLPGKGTILWIRDTADDAWKIHFQQLSVNKMN